MSGRGKALVRGSGGFTLLEVLIALTILGLAVGAIFDLLQTGLMSTEASAGYSRAVLHGNAKMGEWLAKLPIETGGESGVLDDGYTYEVSVSHHHLSGLTEATEFSPGPAAEVYLIEVVIGMPNQKRKLRLQSLRSLPAQRHLLP
jgi:prepilin-type N-terminal cleavage/methylation domain-containing protein